MMRRTLVPLSIVGAILVLQSPIQAQADDSELPLSIERIRAALKRQPPLLQIPAPSADTPTFRIEVQGRFSDLEPNDDKPFDPTYGLPSVGELLMGGVQKIGSAVVDYKRRRAERRARKEVDDALAAFCAVHECPTPDASR
jgi:hypothetical protein